MPKADRRQFSAEQKAQIVRRHLVDRVAVSDLCDEYQLSPSVFYNWQKQALDSMTAALEHGARRAGESSRLREAEQRVAALEARLARKDAVIAEISAEYVQIKKELGES
jgi:transposase